MPTTLRNRFVVLIVAAVLTSALIDIQLIASPAAGNASEASDPPVQYPFACTAQDHGLELVVDNQDGDGVAVKDEDGNALGYSRDCNAETKTWYYGVDTDGNLHIIREHNEGPIDDIGARMGAASLATTTLTDGREVPYLIRH